MKDHIDHGARIAFDLLLAPFPPAIRRAGIACTQLAMLDRAKAA